MKRNLKCRIIIAEDAIGILQEEKNV
jgi:hypothetical protein